MFGYWGVVHMMHWRGTHRIETRGDEYIGFDSVQDKKWNYSKVDHRQGTQRHW